MWKMQFSVCQNMGTLENWGTPEYRGTVLAKATDEKDLEVATKK